MVLEKFTWVVQDFTVFTIELQHIYATIDNDLKCYAFITTNLECYAFNLASFFHCNFYTLVLNKLECARAKTFAIFDIFF